MVRAPSTQFTLDIGQAALKKLEDSVRERFTKALDKNQTRIEKAGERGAKEIIASIARGSGKVTARQSLRNSVLGKYLLSAKGAGELGIPDPEGTLDVLIRSIAKAVDVRTRVFRGKITISARFQPQRLLKMNPHPAKRMASGEKIDIQSWLQWTVGPSRDKGTAGFGLARVGDIFRHLTQRGKVDDSKISSIVQSSRSFGVAGAQAGLMLPLRSVGKGKKSPYEALTGERGKSWSPLPLGSNFWADWWKSNSEVMKKGFNMVIDEIMADVAKELR